MGGYPSATNAYTFVKNSDIDERIKTGAMPDDAGDLVGEEVTLQLREQNFEQHANDVYAVRWTGGGGFGDPFDRDPDDIQHDLDDYSISPAAAHEIYGAVLDSSGRVDGEATAAHRARVRSARINGGDHDREVREGQPVHEVSTSLQVRRDPAGRYWACAKCATDLGGWDQPYKNGCLLEERPVSASNPLIGEPQRFIDDPVVFRQFFCPGCGTLIENEIAVTHDPILNDISLSD
jgi:N-methylhydantoinase B